MKGFPTQEWLRFMREQYPVGSTIVLREMKDAYHPVPPGTKGVLTGIDDIGTFHVNWSTGSSLGVVLGEDSFSVIPPEPQTLKLYMPLHAELIPSASYDYDREPEYIDSRELCAYEDSVLAAILKERMPDVQERGLMEYYGEDDSLNQKVKSYVFTVEEHGGKLWGVCECKVIGELTAEEMELLKGSATGQASDGLGEGFEQRPIQTSNGELYVSLWSSDDNWSMMTEDEFQAQLGQGMTMGGIK